MANRFHFFAISIGGFAFGLQNKFSAEIFAILSGFLTILLLGFIFHARRHAYLARLYISRCREIEKKLGMKQHSYKFYLDKKCDDKPFIIDDGVFTKQRITGEHITPSVPISLIIVF